MNVNVAWALALGLSGILISGESAILLLGMNLPQPSPWSTPVNLALAAADIALGAFLAVVALRLRPAGISLLPSLRLAVAAALLVLLASHAWREWVYLARPDRSNFLANAALSLMNRARMALIVASLVLTAFR